MKAWRFLLVDNYDSFTYNLFHLLEKVCDDAEIKVIRNDEVAIEEAESYDAIIFSPGPGVPSEAGIMPELINRYKAIIPLLGVCLGHQAIAESYGYELRNLDTVYHGVSSELRVTDGNDKLFDHLPERFSVGRYHSWVVNDKTDGELVITARSADGEIMAFRHKTLPIFSVQFHPESILSEFGEQLIRNWYQAVIQK